MNETPVSEPEEYRRMARENRILNDRVIQLESLLNHDPNTPFAGQDEGIPLYVRCTVSKNFNFRTIAEGVEQESQFNALKQEGCDFFQGLFFSLPLDSVEFEAHLVG